MTISIIGGHHHAPHFNWAPKTETFELLNKIKPEKVYIEKGYNWQDGLPANIHNLDYLLQGCYIVQWCAKKTPYELVDKEDNSQPFETEIKSFPLREKAISEKIINDPAEIKTTVLFVGKDHCDNLAKLFPRTWTVKIKILPQWYE